MSGTLYGVGVGPGDPGLITLAAKHVLDTVPVVFAPAPRASAVSLAAEIATKAGADPARIVPVSFPMSRDSAALESAWAGAAARVAATLERGDAAFITLGDPSVYSTWSYLRDALRRLLPAVKVKTIPGIMAMNAGAARLETALVEGDESLALVPLPDPVDRIDAYRSLFDTVVLYKIGSRLPALAAYVESRGLGESAELVVGAGLERECIARFDRLPPAAQGYLSMVLLRSRRRA